MNFGRVDRGRRKWREISRFEIASSETDSLNVKVNIVLSAKEEEHNFGKCNIKKII